MTHGRSTPVGVGQTRLDSTTLSDTRKTQNDVQLAVGFGFPLGR